MCVCVCVCIAVFLHHFSGILCQEVFIILLDHISINYSTNLLIQDIKFNGRMMFYSLKLFRDTDAFNDRKKERKLTIKSGH